MKSITAPAALVACLCLLIGCAGRTQTYDISVKNDLDQPITVWLTKNGPPAEASWLSPEDLAMSQNPRGEKIAGRAVPPGKTAETGAIKGKFPSGTDAILRIYLGQHTLDELLSIGRKDTNRVEVVLSPGKSNLIVRQRDGKLAAEPADEKP
jgi:hypothetical protein